MSARGAGLAIALIGAMVWVSVALSSVADAAQTHVFQATVGVGELSAPAGLAVQASGDLLVADTGGGEIKRFGPTGAPVAFTSTTTNSLGPFALPGGTNQVATVGNRIYVIDGSDVRAFDSEGNAAPFTATASYISGNALTGYEGAAFASTSSVAVDPAGYIYVGDASGFHVFAPTGEAIAFSASLQPENLGVDSTGFTYAGNPGAGYQDGFQPTEYPPTPATEYPETPPGLPLGTALAVDSGNDDVYLGRNGAVTEYAGIANGNAPVAEFGSEQLAAGVSGLAVDRSGGASGGDVYASSGAAVYRFGPQVTVPDVVTGEATAVDSAAGTATLHGTVTPLGSETTECAFEYGLTTAYGRVASCVESATQIGEGSEPVAVHADVSGLEVGDYHFRLRAANANGGSVGGDRTLTIIGAPQIIKQFAVAGSGEAQLNAEIDPGNAVTHYRFEYGTTASYGSTTTTGTLAKGVVPQIGSLNVVGLQPGTTYHFRTIASNAFETVYGPDEVFTTGSSVLAGCPNEALRVGPSALLGECRAYEMVSPPSKGGGEVLRIYSTQSSATGNGIVFRSSYAFAGAAANSAVNSYIARRGDSGWTTEAIDAPQLNRGGLTELTTTATSPDLSKSLQFSRVALTPGAIQGGSNLYLRDNATGARTLIAAQPGVALAREFAGGFIENPVLGGTPDWSRVYFYSEQVLAPGAVENARNEYVYADGTLSLESMPPAPGTGPGEGPGVGVVVGVSADGTYQYLTDEAALAPGSTEAEPGGFNLFAWHTGEYKLIAQFAPGTSFSNKQVSPNGLYFGFETEVDLTGEAPPSPHCVPPGSTEPTAPCMNVYAYDYASGGLGCISCDGPGLGGSELGNLAIRPIDRRVSPVVLDNGDFLITTPNPLVPRDRNGLADVYLWNAGRISLISTGAGESPVNLADATPDGRNIFIRTAQPLVGIDVDSKTDVYDARVEGGIAAQNPPGSPLPCQGEACRGGEAPIPFPLASVAKSPPRECGPAAARAREAAAKAKRLAHRAARAKGRKAKTLHGKAAAERRSLKRLRKQTDQCWRQGR